MRQAFPLKPLVCALATIAACDWALAADAPATLPNVTVQAEAPKSGQATVAGFGDTPTWQIPAQTLSITDRALQNAGVQQVSDLAKLDGSVSGGYNTTGYWDDMTVRGFSLEGAYSYRREGLPYNAETRIPLDNKANLELFKGTSGIQAGVSAPGGLVNLLVKRPEGRIRSAELAWTSARSYKIATDLSDRFGANDQFGVRLNAAQEQLNPEVHDAQGQRHLLSLATDWRISPDTLLEAEIEQSRFSQPSVPGFSMLGNVLPNAKDVDPRINLNNQPWTLPVVFQGGVGTLRLTQQLNADWLWQTTYGYQRQVTQDRIAFPYGCSAAGDPSHYCADGRFDFYDYRSEGELRRNQSLETHADGSASIAGYHHQLSLGVLRNLQSLAAGNAANNPVGTGTVDGTTIIPVGDPTRSTPMGNRQEASTEWYARDAITWNADWTSWLGVRRTGLNRIGIQSDGTQRTQLQQIFTAPWVATGYQFAPRQQVYASWGEGVQTMVAPFPYSGTLDNAGQPLPAQRTRQLEVGFKGQCPHTSWGLNWFRTEKPEANTVGAVYQLDGDSLHQGIEGLIRTTLGAWDVDASGMLLDAKRRNSADTTINGLRPTNVPDHTLKLSANYRVASVPGLSAQAAIIHEGRRMVTPDNTVHVPAWTQLDVGVRYVQRLSNQAITWQAGVQNLTDNRAWRSTPYEFDHVYLLPLAPRTLTASVIVDF
ncbi:MAG: TonB-dependent siderophore receptor [Burkholderiales bacterium]|nr:TonB-dependent siderophore receptor [Burkholderiales bacterium]